MFELILPLVVGASVRVLPKELVLDLGRLSKVVASSTVFHFGAVRGYWQECPTIRYTHALTNLWSRHGYYAME